MKSFVPNNDADHGSNDRPGGHNAVRDFGGTRRNNDAHAGTVDPQARLYRKGKGKSAQLCCMGNVLMEGRHGLAVAASVNCATGMAERESPLGLVDTASS